MPSRARAGSTCAGRPYGGLALWLGLGFGALQGLYALAGQGGEGPFGVLAQVGLVLSRVFAVLDGIPKGQLHRVVGSRGRGDGGCDGGGGGRRAPGRRGRTSNLPPRILADEEKIATVVAGPADVGIFRRLVRFQRHRPANGGEQALALEHVGIVV